MPRYRIAALARADIRAILIQSDQDFGTAARRRYEALILQAIRDVAADPHRFGSLERLDLRGRTYHLRYSRRRASVGGQSVLKPRHLLLYRLEPGVVGIVRILHDAMDFERYAPDPFDDQS